MMKKNKATMAGVTGTLISLACGGGKERRRERERERERGGERERDNGPYTSF